MVLSVEFIAPLVSVEMEVRMSKWLVEDAHDSLSYLEGREPGEVRRGPGCR